MRRAMTLAMAALLVGLGLVSGALAQDYEIRLHRPEKVGSKSRLSADLALSEQTTATIAGRSETTRREFSVEAEAVVTVLEIDKNAEPSKVSLVIEKCIKTEKEKKEPMAAKGTTVVGFIKDNEKTFEIDGRPAGEELAEVLGEIISLGRGGPTDDDIFGTTERKKVGDTWKVNADRAAEDLRQEGVQVRPEDISGTVTLEKAVKVGETECLQLQARMDIAHVAPPIPDAKVEKGTLQARMSGLFPVDASALRIQDSVEATVELRVRIPEGPQSPEVLLEAACKKRTTVRRQPVEAAP